MKTMNGAVTALVSGKGGIGKSTLTVCLGKILAARGQKTILVDMNLGMRALDVMTGLEDRVILTITDAGKGTASPEDVLLPCPESPGLFLLPASQTKTLNDLTDDELKSLFDRLRGLADQILIDTAPGIGEDLRRCIRLADKALLIASQDVVSVRNCDRLRGILEEEGIPVLAGGSPVSAARTPGAQTGTGRTPGAQAGAAGPTCVLTCLGHEGMADFFRSQCRPEIHADLARPEGPEGFASAIVFNLGYLPGGDKSLTTREGTTLAAVRSSLCMLKKDGLLCLTMYSGHPEGAKEKRALLAFAEGLDPKQWHVCYLSMPNQGNHPPEILLISRKK